MISLCESADCQLHFHLLRFASRWVMRTVGLIAVEVV